MDYVLKYLKWLLMEKQKQAEQRSQVGARAQLEAIRREVAEMMVRLNSYSDELEQIGCELKVYAIGLVDFPAYRKGREVYLCWKLGEPAVAYWHELDSGYAGRRRVDDSFEVP